MVLREGLMSTFLFANIKVVIIYFSNWTVVYTSSLIEVVISRRLVVTMVSKTCAE